MVIVEVAPRPKHRLPPLTDERLLGLLEGAKTGEEHASRETRHFVRGAVAPAIYSLPPTHGIHRPTLIRIESDHIMEQLARFDPEKGNQEKSVVTRFRFWAVRIAARATIDRLRVAQDRKQATLASEWIILQTEPDSPADFNDFLLEEAEGILSERQMTIVRARFQGESWKDIAKNLQIREENAHSSYGNARNKLEVALLNPIGFYQTSDELPLSFSTVYSAINSGRIRARMFLDRWYTTKYEVARFMQQKTGEKQAALPTLADEISDLLSNRGSTKSNLFDKQRGSEENQIQVVQLLKQLVPEKLTPRRLRVFKDTIAGKTPKEIAEALGMTLSGVHHALEEMTDLAQLYVLFPAGLKLLTDYPRPSSTHDHGVQKGFLYAPRFLYRRYTTDQYYADYLRRVGKEGLLTQDEPKRRQKTKERSVFSGALQEKTPEELLELLKDLALEVTGENKLHREVIAKTFQAEHYSQIALEEGLTEANVKVIRSRILKKIEENVISAGYVRLNSFGGRYEYSKILRGVHTRLIDGVDVLGVNFVSERQARRFIKLSSRYIDDGLIKQGYILLAVKATRAEFHALRGDPRAVFRYGNFYIKREDFEEFRKQQQKPA